jgi:predicted MPP superfamily phosphohydrolase
LPVMPPTPFRIAAGHEETKLRLPSSTRRRFLQVAAGVAATGALALAEDGAILEPNRPILTAIEVVLTRLPPAFDGFTIAQLSDFHYDVRAAVPIRAAVEMVNNLHPDVVVLTGDFVTVPPFHNRFRTALLSSDAAEPCATLLARLRPRLAIACVLGNHDVDANPARIINILHSHGLPVLRNRSIPIEQAGSRIWLCGLDSAWEGDPDMDLALHGVPSEELVVLLVHEPDYADQAAYYPVDLQLSGHSHGGQIWLPGIGAPWLPPLARKYPRGLHRIGPLTLYTNMGLGTIRVPVRLNCPPQVTLFTLRSGLA